MGRVGKCNEAIRVTCTTGRESMNGEGVLTSL
jgi:hypothetical protein